jgi:hypothetical protein
MRRLVMIMRPNTTLITIHDSIRIPDFVYECLVNSNMMGRKQLWLSD